MPGHTVFENDDAYTTRSGSIDSIVGSVSPLKRSSTYGSSSNTKKPWSAAVIEVDGPTVYVNAGAEENVQAGLVLHVRRKTKDLVDPTTGVVLDTLMSDVGTIRVDQVRDKVSTASVVAGDTPQRGDLLQVQ